MNLADDPLFNTVDEFGRGDFGSPAVDEPGVSQPAGTLARFLIYPAISTYRPADIVGQVFSLQMGRPVTLLTS